MDDTHEVAQLRARIAELESQLTAAPAPPTTAAPGRRSPWWRASSALLIVLACVLAPLSVTAVWASTQVSDTDAYVETVAPLADDPAVQSAVAREVTAAIFANLDVEELATDALTALSQQENVPPRLAAALPALAGPIADGLEGFTRDQVRALVTTPAFAELWAEVNRVAHTQVVALLEGDPGGVVSAQGNTVTLNLAPVIDAVKQRLVDRGFDLAANIPTVERSLVLVQSDAVASAQTGYRLLNTLGLWLPLIALALLAAGVLLASDRRRALLRGALGVTGAMIVLGLALAVFRSVYVQDTPADLLSEAAAGDVFDTLVRFLRTSMRTLAVIGLVVALAAFLAGPSTAAVRARTAFRGGVGSLRGAADAAGWQAGRVGAWAGTHRRALRLSVLVGCGLVLLFWPQPTVWVVVAIALLAVLLIAVAEFLAGPTPASTAATSPAPSTASVPRQRPAEDAKTRERGAAGPAGR
jgi:hypothetical protein